nr:MAG TPA: hypothetical protein [Caudoviricetes sp.]
MQVNKCDYGQTRLVLHHHQIWVRPYCQHWQNHRGVRT